MWPDKYSFLSTMQASRRYGYCKNPSSTPGWESGARAPHPWRQGPQLCVSYQDKVPVHIAGPHPWKLVIQQAWGGVGGAEMSISNKPWGMMTKALRTKTRGSWRKPDKGWSKAMKTGVGCVCSYLALSSFKALSNKDKERTIRAQEEAGMKFSIRKMAWNKCLSVSSPRTQII